VALSVARAWLGEHRASSGRLFQRIREVRGMNYGDYAYIEAFPRGMYQFFPDANIARRAQLFEIWLRPLRTPEEGHMALRIAIHEMDSLIATGLSAEAFEATRNYLAKNVYLLTANQDHQIGYALDAQWYATPEFTTFMRDRLQKLTLADVNAAIRKHLQSKDLSIVVITKDAEGMKARLVTDAPSTVHYDAPKPELAAEDAEIGVMKLGIKPESVKITPVEEVFAR
jgi:zinc protease